MASARRDLPIGVIGVLPPFDPSSRFIRPLPGEWFSALSAMRNSVMDALGPAGLPSWHQTASPSIGLHGTKSANLPQRPCSQPAKGSPTTQREEKAMKSGRRDSEPRPPEPRPPEPDWPKARNPVSG